MVVYPAKAICLPSLTTRTHYGLYSNEGDVIK